MTPAASVTSDVVWLDGRIVPASEATVPLSDRGLTAGEGLFETIRVCGGIPFRLESHVARMRESARALGLPAWDLEGAAAAATPFLRLRGLSEGKLKILATAGPPGGRPTVALLAEPASAPAGPAVLALGPVRALPPGLGAHKTLARLEHRLAQEGAVAAGADEALFLAPDGAVLEGTRTNLFLVRGGSLATPPLDGRILPGITRAVVLELVRGAGIPAEEAPLCREDLARADESFVTGTISGVRAASEILGVRRFDPVPGPITARLATLFNETVRRETAGPRWG
ncbi:MAG: aminotransferase class IV [Planctomycetales bacterium]|nr:aminotransferase class IV [Planctomycetales bacterium]